MSLRANIRKLTVSKRDHETHRATSPAEPNPPPTRQDLSVRALEIIHPSAAKSAGTGDWMHLLEAIGGGDAQTSVTVHKPAEHKGSSMNVDTFTHKAPSMKHQTRSKRLRLRRGGWLCLSGADTGGAYCLLEASLAPGEDVPRHVHTREDETYYVLSGELEATVGGEVVVLRAGDCLMAPRDIPHALRNPGNVENHYLLMFSPPGFDQFMRVTAVTAPDSADAPTEPFPVAARNVREVAADYGIFFG
jgi:mannose-6-phosphate isomerase-like protein (cupin superfamily)